MYSSFKSKRHTVEEKDEEKNVVYAKCYTNASTGTLFTTTNDTFSMLKLCPPVVIMIYFDIKETVR